MTTIAWVDSALILREAGFPNGTPQVTGLAVVDAESRRKTEALYVNNQLPEDDPAFMSEDRGWWQFNDYWHAEVTDAQAYDPLAASKAALRVSGQGKNFTSWAAFNSGAYLAKIYSGYDMAKVATDAASRITALQVRNSSLADQLKNANTLLASANEKVAQNAQTIAELNSELAEADRVIASMESSAAAAAAELAEARLRLAETEAELAAADAKIAAARAALA
jgi:uncharacterized coiled-coil protein SlyX